MFHSALGLTIALAVFVPLVSAPDPAYPLRSTHPTLFAALGTSSNAPVVQALYGAAQRLGPIGGIGLIAGLIALTGALLGWAGVQFGRFKDRLFAQLGPLKYATVMVLLLLMIGVLAKIALRLLFGIKYVLSFPGVNLNI